LGGAEAGWAKTIYISWLGTNDEATLAAGLLDVPGRYLARIVSLSYYLGFDQEEK
jgi:hypothetical protein